MGLALPPHTANPMPVSIANQRSMQGMARISHPLSPTRSRNGSRCFATSDQAEKNRLVKKVLLEKKGTLCEGTIYVYCLQFTSKDTILYHNQEGKLEIVKSEFCSRYSWAASAFPGK